ncbi:hypothetical protein FGC33_04105, partial [Streptococcus pyogenes]
MAMRGRRDALVNRSIPLAMRTTNTQLVGFFIFRRQIMKSKKLVFGQIDLNMCRDFDLVQALDYDFKEKKLYNKGR